MKVLALMGCSKFGNTTEIVRYFTDRLGERMDIEVEYLYLSDHKLDLCVGCHNCIFLGEKKCPHYNQADAIERRLMEADAVVIASPGYMFSVTGIMKNFLDHAAYNCHRPKYFGKKAYIIGNFTKWQKKGVFIPLETWASGAGFEVCGKVFVDMLPFPATEKELDKKRKKLSIAARKFGESLLNDGVRKPKFGDIAIFHSFRTLCRLAPGILEADSAYFNAINAYDKNTLWYVPAKISKFMNLMGNLMERQVRRQVLGMIDAERTEKARGRHLTKLQ